MCARIISRVCEKSWERRRLARPGMRAGMSAYREATQRPRGDGRPTPADAGDGRAAQRTPALPVVSADFSQTLRI